MKKQVKWVLAGAILLVCGVVVAVSALMPPEVERETVAPGTLGDSFTAQATVVPQESMVLTAPTDGLVEAGVPGAGNRFAQGDILLTVDNSALRTQMENQIKTLKLQQSALYSQNQVSRGELALREEQLRRQLEQASHEYSRLFGEDGTAGALLDIAASHYYVARRAYQDAKDLEDGNAIRDSGFMTDWNLATLRDQMIGAEQNYVIAQGDSSATTKAYYQGLIQSSRAQLEAISGTGEQADNSTYAAAQQLAITIGDLQSKLDKGPVVAPYDGVLWQVLVEPGVYVAQDQPLAKIYRPGAMKLEAYLLSEDTLGLSVGQEVACALTDGTALAAKVTFVSPIAQEMMSTIGIKENRCRVELEAQDLPDQVGAGYQADLTFRSVQAQDVLTVAASALVPQGDGSGVYVIRGGKAVLTSVETGARGDGRVEILSGLAGGEEVILSPGDIGIKDGSRVKG